MVRAHSTGGGGSGPPGWVATILLLGALAGAVPIAAAAPAITAAAPLAAAGADEAPGGAHWMRLERRIESGYFRQDAGALQALAATLAPRGSAAGGSTGDAKWRGYYAALLAYRLALLARNDTARAWPFTQQCITRLDGVLALDSGSAEALALQSACLAVQSRLDPWRAPLAAPLSLIRGDRALRLAPRNPRVLLLGALAASDRPRLFGGNPHREFALLRRAVAAFERRSGQPRPLPGWGAADAFTDLARDYLLRGDAVAARNVLERALLVAPDFAQARLLMAEIVSG